MARRFNIGVDVDGILANFIGGARKLLNQLYGKPSDDLVQTTWAFESLGITPEEERNFWKIVDVIPNWWESLERLPDTDSLHSLTDNHRVIFITNRKDGSGDPIEIQTKRWLQNKYWVRSSNVVISDIKGPVAQGLKLDYFIDDRPKNVYEVAEAAPKCQAFMLNATYNVNENYPLRVNTFDDFTKIINAEVNSVDNER